MGTTVVRSGALRSDTFPNSLIRAGGWGRGGTEQASRLRAVRWEKPKGGKAPAAYLRGSFSRTTNTAPKNYDCDENDCAPFAPGSPTRPTGVRARFQSEAAVLRKGGNRKKRTTKELSIFFYCRSLYPCAHQGRRKKRRRREHRFPPRFFIGWVVRWESKSKPISNAGRYQIPKLVD